MYDVEYAGNVPHYAYLNRLMCGNGLKVVSGFTDNELKSLDILDVGAGSNELLRYLHKTAGLPRQNLTGTDLSKESVRLIRRDGFSAYCGRLEEIYIPAESFDVIFLSYFIDYDDNQMATLDAAINLLRGNGYIILEGLFPARMHGVFSGDLSDNTLITKGRSADEDVSLVCNALIKLGANHGMALNIERVVMSDRYIYNRLGFNRRPSTFIVASKAGEG